MSSKHVQLYSDLLVHHMGAGLADGITQGAAGPDEFRTAPLWGLGQRVFFLHDGRTSNLVRPFRLTPARVARPIRSCAGSIICPNRQQQDLLNFLRSL